MQKYYSTEINNGGKTPKPRISLARKVLVNIQLSND